MRRVARRTGCSELVLELQLVADRQPAKGVLRTLDIAQARKRHVVTGNENPLISRHVEQSFSRRNRFFLGVIEMRVPVWMLDGHDTVQACVRPDQQALPFALDLERNSPGE